MKLTDVKKNYNTFSLNCSLEAEPGRITGLIGENGAGKTTTFKAILGLISIDSGKIELIGKTPKELKAADKEKIGVVLSDSGFSEYLKVKDIAAIMKNAYRQFDQNGFSRKCEKMKLPWDKKISEFSAGMKVKLKLAAAMSHEAELLILDEPTAGLDVVARDEILEWLQEYMEQHENAGILISSHISSDLEKICDDIFMIHNGKIILHEETDVLLGDYALLKVDEQQYAGIEKKYILRQKKENFGYRLLTNSRQFYLDNYPRIVVEKGNIDDVILMMTKGELV